MEILIILICVWAICGYFAYGYAYEYFWHEFSVLQQTDGRAAELRIRSYGYALAGPISLLVLLLVGACKHGRKYNSHD